MSKIGLPVSRVHDSVVPVRRIVEKYWSVLPVRVARDVATSPLTWKSFFFQSRL